MGPAATPITSAPVPAVGVQGDIILSTFVLRTITLVGDSASLRRELQATFGVLACWGSHTILKTCQHSPFILHISQ